MPEEKDRNCLEVVLTDEQRDSIYKLCDSQLSELGEFNDQALDRIELASLHFPLELVRRLVQFRRHPNSHGVLVVRNLPIEEDLPATPAGDLDVLNRKNTLSDLVLVSLSIFMGEPIAYEDEKGGRLVHDIFPVKGRENRAEGGGSREKFSHHTEDAIHPNRPDCLALLCVRPDHDRAAINETASIVNALPHIPAAAIPILRQPLFEITPPLSFGRSDLKSRIPALSGNFLMPEMRFNGSFMKGVTEEATWALEKLRSAIETAAISTRLESGDCLIIDNRIATHARSEFEPRYDGHDRWLKRVYAVSDFFRSSRSRAVASHVCAPLNVELTGAAEEPFRL